jgi:hypothetical protein
MLGNSLGYCTRIFEGTLPDRAKLNFGQSLSFKKSWSDNKTSFGAILGFYNIKR